jgi:hypothetical protein
VCVCVCMLEYWQEWQLYLGQGMDTSSTKLIPLFIKLMKQLSTQIALCITSYMFFYQPKEREMKVKQADRRILCCSLCVCSLLDDIFLGTATI